MTTLDRTELKAALSDELRTLFAANANAYNTLYLAAQAVAENRRADAKSAIQAITGNLCASAESTVHERFRAEILAAIDGVVVTP